MVAVLEINYRTRKQSKEKTSQKNFDYLAMSNNAAFYCWRNST